MTMAYLSYSPSAWLLGKVPIQNWNSAGKKKLENGCMYKNVCSPCPSNYVPNLMSLISDLPMETQCIDSAQIFMLPAICMGKWTWLLIQATCVGLLPMFSLDRISAFYNSTVAKRGTISNVESDSQYCKFQVCQLLPMPYSHSLKGN